MTVLAGLSLSNSVPEIARQHAVALAETLAGALVSAVWESAVLVLAVALALRLVPGLSAAVRTRLWLVVLAGLVALPVLPFLLPHGGTVTARHSVQVSSAWSLWLVEAWAVLSLARAVKLVAGALRLRRVARASVPIHPGAASVTLLQHGGRPVELCLSQEVGRPSVVGFFRPRVLLPPALFAALTHDELRQVLLHEMEHLRRHDDWTNLLQKLALVALPLNPALFWVERRLCTERELACDDGVLRATTARKAYAACLVSLAEHSMLRRGAALALGAWEKHSELAKRVHRLLRRPEPVLRPRTARLVVSGLLGGVVAGGVLLAGSPQLVSFAPETAGVAMASTGDVAGDPLLARQGSALRARAVVARASGGAHATLASAVLPPRVGAIAKQPRAHNQAHLRTAIQPAPPRTGASDRRVRQVTYRALQEQQPRLVLLTAWPRVAPVLTLGVDPSDDEFSPSYAAVPMQGGWLLVQL